MFGRRRPWIPKRGVLCVTTGDNYSGPATELSDAMVALDLTTGRVIWSKGSDRDIHNAIMNSRCVAQARGIVFLKMDFPEQLPGFGCERVKPAGHVAEEQRVLASRFPGNVLLAFEAQ